MMGNIVIIGAGQAAAQTVDTLRRKGYTGDIDLVGEEVHLPYQRPPLSKKYLAGALERDRLYFRHRPYYTEHRISLHLGRRAVSVDRSARQINLDEGPPLKYDALLLATGSRPRRLAIPGSELEGIHLLRTLDDVDVLRDAARSARRLVVVGGGYIGLEVAATCRELGLEVTVLEMADRVMNRVVCAELSAFFEAEHAKRGVRIEPGARVREFVGEGRVRAVRTADGAEHAADFVVVGVGVMPNDELALAAGLNCDNGIVVDYQCRSSDPKIFAAGDCANLPCVRYDRRVRLESVDNAFEQATTVALNMLGTPATHDKVPWFWSDQFDLKLLIVGLSQDYEKVVLRGDPATRSFSACYLRDGELIAIDTVNSPRDQMAARKLIAAHVRPDLAKLADPSIALKDSL
ncbi:MAG TPA: FAD-dependent oxidoreductase [Steroidobacteraceae bacterium]